MSNADAFLQSQIAHLVPPLCCLSTVSSLPYRWCCLPTQVCTCAGRLCQSMVVKQGKATRDAIARQPQGTLRSMCTLESGSAGTETVKVELQSSPAGS